MALISYRKYCIIWNIGDILVSDYTIACDTEKITEPNQALEPTTLAVTDRAPSSTLRAS